MAARDLCTIDDVVGYVPGYDKDDSENEATNTQLESLITSESRTIHNRGREFVAIEGADPRTFDITASACARRQLKIGDAAEITQVELFDVDGTTSLGVIDPTRYVLTPRVREEWEPIRRIRFPFRPGGSALIAPGRTLEITGTWGFPDIPADIVEACAKLVIVRYLTDVAAAGTAFADAIADEISVAGLLASAREKIEAYSNGPFA